MLKRGIRTCYFLCKNPACYHIAGKTLVTQRIFTFLRLYTLVPDAGSAQKRDLLIYAWRISTKRSCSNNKIILRFENSERKQRPWQRFVSSEIWTSYYVQGSFLYKKVTVLSSPTGSLDLSNFPVNSWLINLIRLFIIFYLYYNVASTEALGGTLLQGGGDGVASGLICFYLCLCTCQELLTVYRTDITLSGGCLGSQERGSSNIKTQTKIIILDAKLPRRIINYVLSAFTDLRFLGGKVSDSQKRRSWSRGT